MKQSDRLGWPLRRWGFKGACVRASFLSTFTPTFTMSSFPHEWRPVVDMSIAAWANQIVLASEEEEDWDSQMLDLTLAGRWKNIEGQDEDLVRLVRLTEPPVLYDANRRMSVERKVEDAMGVADQLPNGQDLYVYRCPPLEAVADIKTPTRLTRKIQNEPVSISSYLPPPI